MNKLFDKMLAHYGGADMSVSLRARYIRNLCFALLVIIPLVAAYSVYLQLQSPAHGYSVSLIDLTLIMVSFVGVVLTLALIARGRLEVGSYLLLSTMFVAIWSVIFSDRSEPLSRLDTVAYVFALLASMPLLISRARLSVMAFGALNVAVLYVYMFTIGRTIDVSVASFWDYLADNTGGFLLVTAACYGILSINRRALEKTQQLNEELKRTVDGLRRSEEKYRGIFENAIEGFFQSSLEGRFLTVNPAMAGVLGYDSPADLMERVTDIRQQLYIRPDDRDKIIAALLERGRDVGREVQLRRKDGRVIWVSLDERLVRDRNGEPLCMEGFLNDITERKQAEKSLRHEQDRAQHYLDTVEAIIVALNIEGRITTINRKGCQIFGCAEDELIGQFWFSTCLPQPEGMEKVYPVFLKILAGETEFLENFENPIVTRTGELRQIAWHNANLRDEQGQIIGTLSAGEDITERKHLEDQLLQSRKMESVGLLAGGVAHDFNNLLTPILGYTEMLASDFTAGDPHLEQLEEIRKAAEGARNLTQRLLAFSRKQVIELKTIDLGDIIRRFQGMLHQTVREDIRINVSISNAQDAMPEGGTLTIEAADIDFDESYTAEHPETTPGPYVMLAVSDTGVGMDDRTLEHIFEPFFTTKELSKGMGLGLSTVYGIVKQHGGSISVYSEKNHGSTFKIFLPHAAMSDAAERHSDLPTVAVRGEETILVVEDNQMVRTLACRMLGGLGYRVLGAETVERCIELAGARQDRIDVLLTDVIMPRMNGRDLYDLLRRGRPDLKVLFMSGYSSNVIEHHGVLDEGMQLLQKPFTLHTLSAKIRQVLDSPS
jgi:PAS domain S-box-containing protein